MTDCFSKVSQEFSSHGTRSATLGRYYWMPKENNRNASSSARNESQSPNAHASRSRLQSVLKLLSLGVKLLPNLATRFEEILMNTFGQINSMSFPVNIATSCIFLRDCMWASIIQMSRSVDIGIRGCQKFYFSNTQDILNILTGSILENEQDGEPVILCDEERFSGEGLTYCKLQTNTVHTRLSLLFLHCALSHCGSSIERRVCRKNMFIHKSSRVLAFVVSLFCLVLLSLVPLLSLISTCSLS